jgi:hypothetical protein
MESFGKCASIFEFGTNANSKVLRFKKIRNKQTILLVQKEMKKLRTFLLKKCCGAE